MDFNNGDDTINSLVLHGGTVKTGAGLLTIQGGITSQADTAGVASLISGKLSLGGNTRTISVAHAAASPTNDLTISAVISDGGAGAGFIKTGNGILRLTAANTFNGIAELDFGTTVL